MFKAIARTATLLMLVIGITGFADVAGAEDGDHKLAIYVTKNDEHSMRAALDIAVNVTKHYTEQGEFVDIRIILFNRGMHMLRTDTSPVLKRLKSFEQSMPDVVFVGCGNTMDTMARSEGKRPPLIDNVEMVQAGVTELIRLDEAGWTLVRP